MLRTLPACVLTAVFFCTSALALGAQPEPPKPPCPIDFPYDGFEHPLLLSPELWGSNGVRVTAGPDNPAPVTLVFVSRDGFVWKGGHIPVFPGSSVVVGSTNDLAILVRTDEIPGARGTLCAQQAFPDELADIAIPGGCGGLLESRSLRAEGWVSLTLSVPDEQRCRVEVVIEAENPETGERTVIGRTQAITGGTGVIEAYSPPPGYRGPTPFIRVRIECSFEPDSACRALISGGVVPETDVHYLAEAYVTAVCGGAVFDARTSVPALFDLFVFNPRPASPSCPLQVNITFEGLPQGVPQPFPDPIDLDEGEEIFVRFDNSALKATISVSVVCFFSPDGTCQPSIAMGRGTAGTLNGEWAWGRRDCAEERPRAFIMSYGPHPVEITVSVNDHSCPVTILSSSGQAEPKRVATLRPGATVEGLSVKPEKTKGAGNVEFYEVLTLYTRCDPSFAQRCFFEVDIAE